MKLWAQEAWRFGSVGFGVVVLGLGLLPLSVPQQSRFMMFGLEMLFWRTMSPIGKVFENSLSEVITDQEFAQSDVHLCRHHVACCSSCSGLAS